MITESGSGYVYEFLVYFGKDTKYISYENITTWKLRCLTLLNPLFRNGYYLKVDNFYTIPKFTYILVEN